MVDWMRRRNKEEKIRTTNARYGSIEPLRLRAAIIHTMLKVNEKKNEWVFKIKCLFFRVMRTNFRCAHACTSPITILASKIWFLCVLISLSPCRNGFGVESLDVHTSLFLFSFILDGDFNVMAFIRLTSILCDANDLSTVTNYAQSDTTHNV